MVRNTRPCVRCHNLAVSQADQAKERSNLGNDAASSAELLEDLAQAILTVLGDGNLHMALLVAVAEAVENHLLRDAEFGLDGSGSDGLLVLVGEHLVNDVPHLLVELALSLGWEDGVDGKVHAVVLKGAGARCLLAGAHDLVVELILDVVVEVVAVLRVLVAGVAADLGVGDSGSEPVKVGVGSGGDGDQGRGRSGGKGSLEVHFELDVNG